MGPLSTPHALTPQHLQQLHQQQHALQQPQGMLQHYPVVGGNQALVPPYGMQQLHGDSGGSDGQHAAGVCFWRGGGNGQRAVPGKIR